MPKVDPGLVLERVSAARITSFSAVPTMLQMMCEHPSWDTADLSSLTLVQYGGSPVQERVARAWLDRGVRLLQGYGMTEASPGVYMATHDGTLAHPTAVGVPHFFTDVALLRDGRPGAGRRRAGRAGGARPARVRRLLEPAGGDGRRASSTGSGSAPATCCGSTTTAGRTSSTGSRTCTSPAGRTCTPRRWRPSPCSCDAVANCAVVGVADRAVGRGRRRLRAGARGRHAHRGRAARPPRGQPGPLQGAPGTWSSCPSCRATPPARSAGSSCATARPRSTRSPDEQPRPRRGRRDVMTSAADATRRGDQSEALLPPSLQVEHGDGEVAVLRLARAAKRNALNDPTVLGIEAFFAAPPAGVKAVVLDAEGEHFCAGLDLSELTERDAFEGLEHSRMWHRAFERMERGRLPVVAVLKGAVIGGGLELASATHLRVAEPSAFYALPEGQHGLFVGGGGSVRVPRLIGAHRMADMMLTGRVARRARRGRRSGCRTTCRAGGGPGAGAGAREEDRRELPGDELRGAAGAAADRRGQPRRGLPDGVADGGRRGQQRRRPRSGCRPSCRAGAGRCSDDGRDDPRAAASGRRGRPGRPRRSAGSWAGCERERGLRLRRATTSCTAGRSTTSRGSGRRSGSSSGCGSRRRRSAVLGRREMPGAEWFPGATLNYAEHALGARRPDRDADEVAVLAYSQTRDRHGADLGAAARAGRPRPRRAAAARRRPRRPGGGLPAEHPGDAGGVPRHRQPGRGLGELRAGVRRPQRGRPVRPDRADGAAGRRAATATAARTSTAASRSPRSGPACRPCDTSSTSRTARTRCPTPLGWDELLRRTRRRSPSSRCRSRTRWRCCSPPAPPASRRRSCTATAGSCSST